MDRGVELRHLRSFEAVADTLHFGRAAERLGIAQPALSQQIRRLESLLNTPLFERTSRRVALTDAGHVLWAQVPRLVDDFGKALEATRRAGRGEMGVLRVAFAASVMFQTLPTLIRRFRARYPEVRLELRELPTGLQIPALLAGTLDVGFVREPPAEPGLRMETVMREPLVLAVAQDSGLETGAEGSEEPTTAVARLQTVRDAPFVLFPRNLAPGLHDRVMALCTSADFVPRVVQESRELYTTVSLVEAGIGVTIVPASIQKMGWRGVRYLPLHGAETRVEMAWAPARERPVVQVFLALVRAVLRGEFANEVSARDPIRDAPLPESPAPREADAVE